MTPTCLYLCIRLIKQHVTLTSLDSLIIYILLPSYSQELRRAMLYYNDMFWIIFVFAIAVPLVAGKII